MQVVHVVHAAFGLQTTLLGAQVPAGTHWVVGVVITGLAGT